MNKQIQINKFDQIKNVKQAYIDSVNIQAGTDKLILSSYGNDKDGIVTLHQIGDKTMLNDGSTAMIIPTKQITSECYQLLSARHIVCVRMTGLREDSPLLNFALYNALPSRFSTIEAGALALRTVNTTEYLIDELVAALFPELNNDEVEYGLMVLPMYYKMRKLHLKNNKCIVAWQALDKGFLGSMSIYVHPLTFSKELAEKKLTQYLEDVAEDGNMLDKDSRYDQSRYNAKAARTLASTQLVTIKELAVNGVFTLQTSLRTNGASSGRFTAKSQGFSMLNMQAAAKECIIYKDDEVGLNVDLPSIELLIALKYAGSANVLKLYELGIDLHTAVASIVLNTPASEITKKQRALIKSVSFGILFGMGVKGLAENIGSTIEVASDITAKYFKAFPQLKGLITALEKETEERGYITLPTGMKCFIKKDAYGNLNKRQGRNAITQGICAAIINECLGELAIALQQSDSSGNSYINATVYDSISVVTTKDKIDQSSKLLLQITQGILGKYLSGVSVGLAVDVV